MLKNANDGAELEQKDIFELLHRRRKKSTSIFCSQYEFEEWYDQLGGDASPLVDAIIDRIAHDSYRINIMNILMLESHRSNASEPPAILTLESQHNHNI